MRLFYLAKTVIGIRSPLSPLQTIFQTFFLLLLLPFGERHKTRFAIAVIACCLWSVFSFSQSNRLWATYYGGMGDDFAQYVVTDTSGNVYLAGHTLSSTGIASGGFQNTFSGGVNYDGFLVKFSSTGARLWGTYYGGSGGEWIHSTATDVAGNVYLAGFTESPGIASGGFQNTMGGGAYDAFLVKFDAAGNRLWATYYGGTGIDWGYSIAADPSGTNVYLAGLTTSPGIASGGFQNASGGGNDAFVVKFDATTGNRLWATYYGGSGSEYGYNIATDISGNVYLTGVTTSISGVASGGFQNVPGGNNDAFLVKFDAAGNRLWATYYGGGGIDYGYSVSPDSLNGVYLAGQTGSSGMASGGFQNVSGGGNDAFLVKFDATTGNRLWATYYGGSGTEEGYSVAVDTSGVYLAGDSYSTNNISSGGFQNTLIGVENLFIAKFDADGNRLCATYYGANHDEKGYIALDQLNRNIYISGYTPSNSGIASGGFQNSWGGGVYDACLIKFSSCAEALSASVTGSNILCKNQCTGTATVTPTGGISPYTYSWATGLVQTTQTATGLCAGNYSVTITDATGITTIDTVAISEPAAILATSLSSIVPISCNGQCTGSATVNATGGTSNYTYSWSALPIQNSAIATGLCAGTYTAIATDANGCTSTQTVTITEPTALTASATASPATCGNNNGSATVTANGGTGTLSYSWYPSGGTSAAAPGLSAGNYTVTVTDANSCSQTQSVTITNSNGPTLALVSQTNVVCYGENNASATVTAANGTSPYTYSWVQNGGTNATANNLTAGNYTATVADANGCTSTQIVTITEPAAITASITSTPASCGNNNGTASVNATGGNGALAYSWNLSAQTTATATGLSAGNYTVTITDTNGCTKAEIITITSSNGPNVTLASSINVVCYGGSDGSAAVAVAGGSPPYAYLWNPTAAATAAATGLSAGTYTVIVTDANNCTALQTTTITEPAAIIAGTTTNSASCDSSNGEATVIPGGGTGPFSYSWNQTNQTSPTATGLAAGSYTVTVTDANGCITNTNALVAETLCPCPTNLSLALPNAFSPNGDGENDEFCLPGQQEISDCIRELTIAIYDRWGEKIFESANPDFCWDGFYKGNPHSYRGQNPAVYMYYLEVTATNNIKTIKQGNISLVK